MSVVSRYYGIIGAGGHGRETMPYARAALAPQLTAGRAELVFVVEGVPPKTEVNGHRVLSYSDFRRSDCEKYFNVAIGDSYVRHRISMKCQEDSIEPFSVAAPTSVVLDGTHIGEGSILSAFTAVTSNVTIGRHFHGNNFSNVAHDCVIGDFVTFAPGVRCNGHVHIGDHAYIGAGAVIRNGSAERPLVIGENAIVGMGAVVVRDVPAGATVVGVPARVVATR